MTEVMGWDVNTTFGKVKFHPITCVKAQQKEKRYNSTLSLTSALDGSRRNVVLPCQITGFLGEIVGLRWGLPELFRLLGYYAAKCV